MVCGMRCGKPEGLNGSVTFVNGPHSLIRTAGVAKKGVLEFHDNCTYLPGEIVPRHEAVITPKASQERLLGSSYKAQELAETGTKVVLKTYDPQHCLVGSDFKAALAQGNKKKMTCVCTEENVDEVEDVEVAEPASTAAEEEAKRQEEEQAEAARQREAADLAEAEAQAEDEAQAQAQAEAEAEAENEKKAEEEEGAAQEASATEEAAAEGTPEAADLAANEGLEDSKPVALAKKYAEKEEKKAAAEIKQNQREISAQKVEVSEKEVAAEEADTAKQVKAGKITEEQAKEKVAVKRAELEKNKQNLAEKENEEAEAKAEAEAAEAEANEAEAEAAATGTAGAEQDSTQAPQGDEGSVEDDEEPKPAIDDEAQVEEDQAQQEAAGEAEAATMEDRKQKAEAALEVVYEDMEKLDAKREDLKKRMAVLEAKGKEGSMTAREVAKEKAELEKEAKKLDEEKSQIDQRESEAAKDAPEKAEELREALASRKALKDQEEAAEKEEKEKVQVEEAKKAAMEESEEEKAKDDSVNGKKALAVKARETAEKEKKLADEQQEMLEKEKEEASKGDASPECLQHIAAKGESLVARKELAERKAALARDMKEVAEAEQKLLAAEKEAHSINLDKCGGVASPEAEMAAKKKAYEDKKAYVEEVKKLLATQEAELHAAEKTLKIYKEAKATVGGSNMMMPKASVKYERVLLIDSLEKLLATARETARHEGEISQAMAVRDALRDYQAFLRPAGTDRPAALNAGRLTIPAVSRAYKQALAHKLPGQVSQALKQEFDSLTQKFFGVSASRPNAVYLQPSVEGYDRVVTDSSRV